MRVEQEKKTGNVESVTLEQVPMEERKSWADVAMIQAGIMICVPSLMLGGVYADVSGHLVRGNRICSDRGVDDILWNHGK